MKFLHMRKELNGLGDQALSHWFPMGKGPPQVWAWRLGSEGGVRGGMAQPNTYVI